MALDPHYILSPPIEQYFVDKDSGLPLSGGTLTFYRDIDRITIKPVYQLTGTPPNYGFTTLPNPLTLSAVGTIQNESGDNVELYFYPYDTAGNIDLYYIVCQDQNGVEQFTREAFPANTAIEDETDIDTGLTQNQLSNPQFTRVLLNSDEFATTYTVTDATETTFALAPDWDILITGTAATTSTVIVQRIAIQGNEKFVTTPPYVLDIQTGSGITSCRLRQRLNTNSGLWTTTSENTTDGVVVRSVYLSGSITGLSFNTSSTIKILYQESSGTNFTTPVEILNKSLVTTGYVSYESVNAIPVPSSTNTDSGTSGYVDIYVVIPTNAHVRITSIQVIPVLSPIELPYDLESANREQALLGDYYIPRLEAKQIPSLLVGWDFPLNPSQTGKTGTIVSTAAYIWDQTIGLDLANSATYANNSVTGGLQVTTVGANSAFYIMQYLDAPQTKKILGSRLSVNVFGYKGTLGEDVVMRVYLYRAPSSSTFPTLPTSIGTVDTSGVFTVAAAGWTEIPRSGLDTAKATLNAIDTATPNYANINLPANNYGFSGWELTDTAQIQNTDKFSIVVTFAYETGTPVITLNSVSVVPGDIPCRPGLQTSNQVFSECQYYLQKSFLANTFPASPYVAPGINTGESVSGVYFPGTLSIGPIVKFATPMRASPAVTVYNPAVNANAQARDETAGLNAASTTIIGTTTNGFFTTCVPSVSGGLGNTLGIHWVADARIGK